MILELVDNLKVCLFLGILCFFSIKSLAHDPDEAYFTINFQGDSCLVEAEFPWAFRNALLKEFPELEKQKTTATFQEAVKKYFQKYFLLKKDGQILDFQIKQIEGSHSHSVKYILTFDVTGFQKIEFQNICMLNLYPNQVNHHTISWKEKQYQVETNAQQTSFTFDRNPNQSKQLNSSTSSWLSYTVIALIIILLLISLLFILKKYSKKRNP